MLHWHCMLINYANQWPVFAAGGQHISQLKNRPMILIGGWVDLLATFRHYDYSRLCSNEYWLCLL